MKDSLEARLAKYLNTMVGSAVFVAGNAVGQYSVLTNDELGVIVKALGSMCIFGVGLYLPLLGYWHDRHPPDSYNNGEHTPHGARRESSIEQ